MDISKIYEAFIYIKHYNNASESNINYFHKVALVMRRKAGKNFIYVDIKTGDKYNIRSEEEAEINSYYINSIPGLIPYAKLVNSQRKHLSRKKVLKKYDNTKERKY